MIDQGNKDFRGLAERNSVVLSPVLNWDFVAA